MQRREGEEGEEKRGGEVRRGGGRGRGEQRRGEEGGSAYNTKQITDVKASQARNEIVQVIAYAVKECGLDITLPSPSSVSFSSSFCLFLFSSASFLSPLISSPSPSPPSFSALNAILFDVLKAPAPPSAPETGISSPSSLPLFPF